MDEQEKLYDETTAGDVVNDSEAYGQEDTTDEFKERLDEDDTVGVDDTTVGDRSLDSDSLGSVESDSATTDDGFREKMPMGDEDETSEMSSDTPLTDSLDSDDSL